MEEGSKKVSQKVKFLPRRFLVVASNGFQWKKIKKRSTEIVKFLPKIFFGSQHAERQSLCANIAAAIECLGLK